MASSDEGRYIGQSGYWTRFAVLMIGVPALIGFGIYSLVNRDFGLAILSILAIFPLSIWFRFVMMRRCRDIGWPVFLPWTAQGLQFLMVFMMISSGGVSGGGIAAIRAASSGSMLIGLADFVLVIALGCVRSRTAQVDYAAVFGGEPHYADRASPRMPTDYGAPVNEHPDATRHREDAAIARALEAHRRGPARSTATSQPVATPQPVATSLPPRVAGFGRKGL